MNLRSEGASLVQISQETQMNLIQTKENFKKIKDMLEQHSKKTSLTLFEPIIEGLVEMSSKVNPETLNNVLNLIARLITALQEG
jgi:ferritin-like metal-binding protein YciE